MGDDIGDTAVYFDSCRTLRNRSDYDRVGVVSETEVDELLREVVTSVSAPLADGAGECIRGAVG